MKSPLSCLLAPLCLVFSLLCTPAQASVDNPAEPEQRLSVIELQEELGLLDRLDANVFARAYQRYLETNGKRKPLLTIIDYSKPSTQKRFFVIDMDKRQLLFDTYTTHGVNSGYLFANDFSNIVNSRQTSLGAFLTDDTYYGGNGYSLRMDGLDPGINDNARRRYIVIHGADYANPALIHQQGRLGRSWGCPALPQDLARKVIDTIKGGSLIYAHG
ncbi:murein L,D-transpeptidase catalytic domain family protein [Ferrimonas pelagia]